jgi:predicted Zn-dependent protease
LYARLPDPKKLLRLTPLYDSVTSFLVTKGESRATGENSGGEYIRAKMEKQMTKAIKRLNWSVVLLCVALFGFGCETVEYTGRTQVNLIPDSDEKKLGVDAYQDILKKTPLSGNQAWQAQLKQVGQRISSAAANPDYQWEFNVLEGNDVNAFCLPGGKVAF